MSADKCSAPRVLIWNLVWRLSSSATPITRALARNPFKVRGSLVVRALTFDVDAAVWLKPKKPTKVSIGRRRDLNPVR